MDMDGVTLFDMTEIHPSIKGYSGVVSDGHYLYFIPLNNGDFFGTVARYSLNETFSDAKSWHTFDTTRVDKSSQGFVDGIFDGRYLYLIPFCNDKHHGQVTRYDTSKAFDDIASWQVFDSSQLHPNSKGFVSGCYDGRYLYLSPYQLDHATHHGQVTRYDTHAEFCELTAWQVYDTAQTHIDSRGFHSAVSDEQYVYFVPYLRDAGVHNGILLCYEKSKAFDDTNAWQYFDMTQLGEECQGYIGAVYHKGMIYFAPYRNNEQRHGNVLRFNTNKNLHDLSAWTVFNCEKVDIGSRGFFGAICDDEYLYLLPHCRGLNNYHGQLTRYKLTQNFEAPESWSICELENASSNCKGFIGGLIQKKKLYLAPFEIDAGCHSGVVACIQLDKDDIWQQPATEVID
ncbi:hypothetical protein [Algibacillus agarilyticus]|uniref:hypothetical protein n=1 Tax=Algibacillus agarilyticus TaxID=2234133 RepID=UPI000DCF6961|nr:hypothetical protein [Algibacillus agarilyticus]